METRSTLAVGAAQHLTSYTLAYWGQKNGDHVDVTTHARAVKHCAVIAVEYQHQLSLRVFVCL
jgi:hypothetical protein